MFGTDLSIVTIRGSTGGALIVRRGYDPAAIGDAVAAPERKAVAVTGDGGTEDDDDREIAGAGERARLRRRLRRNG